MYAALASFGRAGPPLDDRQVKANSIFASRGPNDASCAVRPRANCGKHQQLANRAFAACQLALARPGIDKERKSRLDVFWPLSPCPRGAKRRRARGGMPSKSKGEGKGSRIPRMRCLFLLLCICIFCLSLTRSELTFAEGSERVKFTPSPCYEYPPPNVTYDMSTTCTRFCGMFKSTFQISRSRSNPSMIVSPLDKEQVLYFHGLTYWFLRNIGDDDFEYMVLKRRGFSLLQDRSVVQTDVLRHVGKQSEQNDEGQLIREEFERLHGEDARVFAFNNSLWLVYNVHTTYHPRMEFTQIRVKHLPASPSLSLVNGHWKNVTAPIEKVLIVGMRNTSLHMRFFARKERDEKNWSPFEYRNTSSSNESPFQLFWIYTIQPHRVLQVSGDLETDVKHGLESRFKLASTKYLTRIEEEATNSSSKTGDLQWKTTWGNLRGSTPALRLPAQIERKRGHNSYLTFFHSSLNYHASVVRTYFVGAYLFEAEPPFRITHMSTEPLVAPSFYNASISGWAYKKCDFILFPMSFYFDERSDNDIYMSYGRQDREGWIAHIDTRLLLASLSPVKSGLTEERPSDTK